MLCLVDTVTCVAADTCLSSKGHVNTTGFFIFSQNALLTSPALYHFGRQAQLTAQYLPVMGPQIWASPPCAGINTLQPGCNPGHLHRPASRFSTARNPDVLHRTTFPYLLTRNYIAHVRDAPCGHSDFV